MEDKISFTNPISIEYKTNLLNPPIDVKHSCLNNADEESPYKKICPSCKIGLLLVKRDANTFILSNTDRCIVCGQEVIYTDIVELRNQDHFSIKS